MSVGRRRGNGLAAPLTPLSPRGTARQRLAPAPAVPPEAAEALREADLGEEAFYLAWQVAEWADELSAAERAAFLTLVARSLLAVAQGSTRLPLDATASALCARVPALVGSPGERKPFILAGEHLYHQKLLASEDRLVAALRARLNRPGPFPAAAVERVVAVVAETAVPRPSDEQRAAVRSALSGRLALVSGGPGTGKTTIALALMRALVRLGVDPGQMALAAPTGRAAHRLEETIRQGLARLSERSGDDEALVTKAPAAETLHRLLGYMPALGSFAHHENNRLGQRVVIVDEGSMIDLLLMERLLRSLAEDAQLILLGDADQLPSVHAGAVFRDLAPHGVRLGRSFRMDPSVSAGRAIAEVARRVNAGDATDFLSRGGKFPKSPDGPLVRDRRDAAELAFEAVERVPAAAREALLARWYDERLASCPALASVSTATCRIAEGALDPDDEARIATLHRHYQSARLLCLTHARPTGVLAINASLHRRHGASSAALGPGEPVMMLRNDYDRGLFNGDQGVIVRLRDAGRSARLAAAFPTRTGFRLFDLEGLRDTVALSFAMTVHKAQGSEFDHVVLWLPETPSPLLTREVLYTALTRSRLSVTICGAPEILAQAVASPLIRSTGVGEKLAAAR